MDAKFNRRKFLISIPFLLNIKLKKNLVVIVFKNNKEIYYYYDYAKVEEIPFKILNNHQDCTELIVQYSNDEKYYFKQIFWKVPLLEDLKLWSKQKWNKFDKIWDEEKVELILTSF